MLSTVFVFIVIFNLWCVVGVKPVSAVSIEFGESQITLNNSEQLNPDIYQYGLNHFAIVWQDNRNGNWDIYMYYQNHLGDGTWDVRYDVQITSKSGNNELPKIYDDVLVYQSDRNGNWDIFMYNLTTKVETQITTDLTDQVSCAVYDDIIVWQDWRNMWFTNPYNSLWIYPGMDIYIYNLTSNTEEQLPLSEEACFSPAISKDQIVFYAENYDLATSYYDFNYVTPYVCAYNISTGVGFNVVTGAKVHLPKWSSSPRPMSSPAFDGSIIAWTENSRSSGAWKFVVKNVTSNFVWSSESVAGPYYPDVSGNFVVYQGFIDGDWDLYLYDVSSGSLFVVDDGLGNQENPAISTNGPANFIVYQDNRNGNWDIYLSAFWHGAMGGGGSSLYDPITPSYVIDQLEQTMGWILETPIGDFAGANDKVKENRKEALLDQFDSAITNIDAAVNAKNLKLRIKYFQCAIDVLDGLVVNLDGWTLRGCADLPGSGFTPDWMGAAQYFDQVPRECANYLQTIINGST